jgi:predicted Zn-dependent protease
MTWSRLGVELLREGRCHAAAAVLHEAVRRETADGRVWFALGRAYYETGRLTQAEAALFIAQLNRGPQNRIAQYQARIARARRAQIIWSERDAGAPRRGWEAGGCLEALLSDGGGVAERG